MPSSADCGCRRGAALNFKAMLSEQEPPDCPYHFASPAVPEPHRPTPSDRRSTVALNDNAALTGALSTALGVPVGRTSDLGGAA